MKTDRTLDQIVKTLTAKHGCHTILLYGSRARGDHNEVSDYDVSGISSRVKKPFRIAKKVKGAYWDVFIYPEKDLKKVGESHLMMKDAVILKQKGQFGSNLLKRLDRFHKVGPKKLADWETELKRTWLQKTFERSLNQDPEGHFRRLWLIIGLLEDYFCLRGKWYRGSKHSLSWLKLNDPASFRLFEKVLRKPSDEQSLKKLIQRVIA